jgi:LPXTG-motif cell wall-anchored protein
VLGSGVKFVSCNYGCTHSGQLVTWNIPSLTSGASRQLAVTVKVLASSGRLPNTADIEPANGTGASPSTPGPVIGATSILAPSQPARRGPGSDLPRTGGAPLLALVGLALLGAGYAVRRSRIA